MEGLAFSPDKNNGSPQKEFLLDTNVDPGLHIELAEPLGETRENCGFLQDIRAFLNSDDKDYKAMGQYLSGMVSTVCGYCDGFAHHAGECSGLKKTTRGFKGNPVWKKKYGTYKGSKKKDGKTLGVKRAVMKFLKEHEDALVDVSSKKRHKKGK